MFPGISFGEIILVLFWFVFLLKKGVPIDTKYSIYLLVFVGYVFFSFAIVSFYGFTTKDVLFRSIRFSFYYLTVVLWTKEYLDINVFFKWMKVVIYTTFVFIVFQYVMFYYMNKVVMGYIPGFKLSQEVYENSDWTKKYTAFFRASSLFYEPAHLCQYYFIYLVYALFKKKDKSIIEVLITTSGIILSTSGQGIIIASTIWGCYFIKNWFVSRKRKDPLYTIVQIIVVIIVVILVVNTSVFQNTISRLSRNDEQSASYARLNVYTYLFEDLKGLLLVFGRGFGSIPKEGVFVPGLAYTIYGSGIIGLFLIILHFLKSFIKGDVFGRMITVVFAVLLLGSSIFMNLIGILYLAIMQSSCLQNDSSNSMIISKSKIDYR